MILATVFQLNYLWCQQLLNLSHVKYFTTVCWVSVHGLRCRINTSAAHHEEEGKKTDCYATMAKLSQSLTSNRHCIIYSLLTIYVTPLSGSHTIQQHIVGWLTTNWGYGSSRSVIRGTRPEFTEGTGENRGNLRVVGLRAEIRTWDPPNAEEEF
jgi:hypothetical protein